jgi:hypothetical protein
VNKIRFAKRPAAAIGFIFLCAPLGLTNTQSTPPSRAKTRYMGSPAGRRPKDTHPVDDFAGFQFTDDQKLKIDEIHKNIKSRLDAVFKDEKLNAEQKGAMLDGYRRMEMRQIFRVLTPEQQTEVSKRVLARRAAEREENKTKQQSLPK